jgi:ABC-2 type transport system permease protein
VLAAFFGYLIGGTGTPKTSRIDIALVMQDSGAISSQIAAGLKTDTSLRVTEMTLAQAETMVRKGAQKVAVVLPAGFGDAAGAALFGAGAKPQIGLLYDPSQQIAMAMVRGILTQHVMQTVSGEMMSGQEGVEFTQQSIRQLDEQPAPGDKPLREFLGSLKEYQAHQQQSPDTGAQPAGMTVPFTTSERAMTSESAKAGYNSYAHAFAGMAVQFLLFMGIDMGVSVLQARRTGIWSRLLAAPVTQTTVILSRAASCALIALVLMLVIFGVAVAVFGVHIANLPGFIGIAFCFALLTASFGLLVAAFGKTPDAARGIAIFATLIMVMLSGAWMPSFLFPEWMQSLTLVIPTRWAVDGFDAMTWRGLGMDAAWMAMGVQLAFAAAFILLALWRFNRDRKAS